MLRTAMTNAKDLSVGKNEERKHQTSSSIVSLFQDPVIVTDEFADQFPSL